MGIKLNKKQKFGLFMAVFSGIAAGLSMLVAILTGNDKAIKKALGQVEDSKKNDEVRTESINVGNRQKEENSNTAKNTSESTTKVINEAEARVKSNEEIIKENEELLRGIK